MQYTCAMYIQYCILNAVIVSVNEQDSVVTAVTVQFWGHSCFNSLRISFMRKSNISLFILSRSLNYSDIQEVLLSVSIFHPL